MKCILLCLLLILFPTVRTPAQTESGFIDVIGIVSKT